MSRIRCGFEHSQFPHILFLVFALISFGLGTACSSSIGGNGDEQKRGGGLGSGPGNPFKCDPNISFQPLAVPVTVKETAGVDTNSLPTDMQTFPVQPFVVPLPLSDCLANSYQGYFANSAFNLVDSSGKSVPAQFDDMTRWWSQDGSMQHVQVSTQAKIGAWGGGTQSGVVNLEFRDDSGDTTSTQLDVAETSNVITVDTGRIKFDVRKDNFDIINQLWLDLNGDGSYTSSEQIIEANSANGGMFVRHDPQSLNDDGLCDGSADGGDVTIFDSNRSVTVQVEKQGPMVVRIIARADGRLDNNHSYNAYNAGKGHTFNPALVDHDQGFAVRITAYAGKPFVDIEYQLQNTQNENRWGRMLYFQELRLNSKLKLSSPSTRVGIDGSVVSLAQADSCVAQETDDTVKIYDDCNTGGSPTGLGSQSDGWLDVRDGSKGVLAYIDKMPQVYPKGIEFDDATDFLSLQLFPDWSAQHFPGQASPNCTGYYWLEDMQSVVVKTKLYFHDASISDQQLKDIGALFRQPPVAVLPTSWYGTTKSATLDMGGVLPDNPQSICPASGCDQRQLGYGSESLSWIDFGAGSTQRKKSCGTGSAPRDSAFMILSEDPVDYLKLGEMGLGEINVRPVWGGNYVHDTHWPTLRWEFQPYCDGSWAAFDGNGSDANSNGWKIWPNLPNTNSPTGRLRNWDAWDLPHYWGSYVELSRFMLSGDPWIQDHYQFLSEYMRHFLRRSAQFHSSQLRAQAHGLMTSLHALRVTGDAGLLDEIKDYLEWMRTQQNLDSGVLYGNACQTFQDGYFNRAAITAMYEFEDDRQTWAEIYHMIAGSIEHNAYRANFSYSCNNPRQSSGSSFTMGDPQAWFYWNSGRPEFLQHLKDYINGLLGSSPNNSPGSSQNLNEWEGKFSGRWSEKALNETKSDLTPPSAVTGLQATSAGSDIVVTFDAPSESDTRYYHILFSDKPIRAVGDYDQADTSERHWWAADVVVPNQQPSPGVQESFTVTPPYNLTNYTHVGVVSFDSENNMSALTSVPIQ